MTPEGQKAAAIIVGRLRAAATAIALCPQMETHHGETQDLAVDALKAQAREIAAMDKENDRLMTPAEQAVIDAARKWQLAGENPLGTHAIIMAVRALRDAVHALDAARNAKEGE